MGFIASIRIAKIKIKVKKIIGKMRGIPPAFLNVKINKIAQKNDRIFVSGEYSYVSILGIPIERGIFKIEFNKNYEP